MFSTTRSFLSVLGALAFTATVAPSARAVTAVGVVGGTPSTKLLSAGTARDDMEQQADSAFRQAQEAMSRGDFRRAATLFRRVVDRFPKSARAGEALYFSAYSLFRTGGTSNLANALDALETLKDDYPQAYSRDGGSLRMQVCGELARRGDESCASEVVKTARSGNAAQSGQQGSSCPTDDDENDDRIMALNALMQMNSDAAVPVLERLLARRDGCASLRKKAVFILSQQRGDRVADVLMDAARNDPSPEVREQAVFWLGQTSSERAVDVLSQILRDSNDPDVQQKAVFALSQSPSPRARQAVRDLAQRSNVSKDVREQAIFFLGQSRGEENAAFLRDLYGQLNDVDLKEKVLFSLSQENNAATQKWLLDVALNEREGMEMRKKALFYAGQQRNAKAADLGRLYDGMKDREMREQIVFTLSQRPDSAAVDVLMRIARTETDRDLRSKAVFWLGQSRDPRVPKFLEELINRRPED